MAESGQVEEGADVWADSGVAQQDFPPGLYVVATPLGNAADVSLRALWILRRVDAIAAEDTRTTAPWLARYGIATACLALHRHNEAQAGDTLLARLRQGARLALVSDAGTPAISDPGALLVRAALAHGVRVIPVPGPSSLTAALSVAGIVSAPVSFFGFAPARGAARRAFWREAARAPGAAVFFEAPHRLEAAVRDLAEAFAPDRRVVLAHELTKKFESVTETSVAGLRAWLEAHPPRGEFVIVVDGAAPAALAAGAADTIDEGTARWIEALAAELPAARAAAVAARASGLPRELLYRAICARKGVAAPD